jgi:hypothetical protein
MIFIIFILIFENDYLIVYILRDTYIFLGKKSLITTFFEIKYYFHSNEFSNFLVLTIYQF